MTRLTIIITDTPEAANQIALSLRRYLLRNTQAFVSDNCAVGSVAEPRLLVAEFEANVKHKSATVVALT